MKGSPEMDFSKARKVEFNISRITAGNDTKNIIRTIPESKNNELGIESGSLTILIFLFIIILKRSS